MTINLIAGNHQAAGGFVPLAPTASDPGTSVDNRAGREIIPGYRLIAPIGAGGYGEVWRAEAPGGLAKAIKIVYGQSAGKRATDELKSLSRIKDVRHPFLLTLERIEIVDDQLVIVSELADSSLKDRYHECLSAGQPGIPRSELLRHLSEVADVLDYMTTEYGLQHLDIKPENLLLVAGHVKVADFGLVKSVHDVAVSMIAGLTPTFAAPETFDGRPSDRSDQYSLAVVYQLLLTGRCPFQGQTMAQLAAQHLNGRPDVSSLPEAERPVILRALAKNPYDRFSGCRALIERLSGQNGSIPTSLRANDSPPLARRPPAAHADAAPRNDYKTEVIDVRFSPPSSTAQRSQAQELLREFQGTIVDLPPMQLAASNELQPTLFIGLGGCGSKALRSLATLLQNRWGALEAIPSLRMLLIDTDAECLDRRSMSSDDFRLSEEQVIHAPLKPTAYYRNRSAELTSWLSRRWIYNIPKSLKTEGLRPLGRLALVDAVQHIDSRLNKELTAICDPANAAHSSQSLDVKFNPNRPRIVIFASISGGTGSGMIWDVVQLAYQSLRQRNVEPIDLICVLANWSSSTASEKEMATVNACASLRELLHYGVEGCPGDASCHLQPRGPHHGLFDQIYLLNFGPRPSEEAFNSAAHVLAEFVDANTGSPSGDFLAQSRSVTTATHERESATVRTFSLARIAAADLAEIEPQVQQFVAQACVEPSLRENDLVRRIGEVLDQEEQEHGRGLATRILNDDPDAATLAKRTFAVARQCIIEKLFGEKVEQLQSKLLNHGGFRRYLIVAPEGMQRAGLVDLVQKILPSEATVALHDKDELLLLCEAYGIPAKAIALSLVCDRPELLELVGRVPTRCDISWAPL